MSYETEKMGLAGLRLRARGSLAQRFANAESDLAMLSEKNVPEEQRQLFYWIKLSLHETRGDPEQLARELEWLARSSAASI
jgi:hypothetical protein